MDIGCLLVEWLKLGLAYGRYIRQVAISGFRQISLAAGLLCTRRREKEGEVEHVNMYPI